MIALVSLFRGLGNKIYEHAFPIYRPVYAAYKAYADHAERQLLRRILVPGAVAVDAGANIGIYSQFLARCVGPAGAVYSFEPAPENFERLRAVACAFSNMHASIRLWNYLESEQKQYPNWIYNWNCQGEAAANLCEKLHPTSAVQAINREKRQPRAANNRWD